MRSFTAALCGWVCCCAVAWSQESAPSTGSALARSGWVQAKIARGRLIVANTRAGNGRIACNRPAEEGQETVALEADGQHMTLTCACDTPQERRWLEVRDEREIRYRYQSQTSPDVEFHQPASGPVTLTIGSEKRTAKTVWHLLLGHDEVCRGRVAEMLHFIRPDWRLSERLTAVEHQLTRPFSPSAQAAEEQAVRALIAALGHAEYGERQAAYRALQSAGPAVLGHLERTDFAALDAEQRSRVRALQAELAAATTDAPETAAALVQDDPRVWLGLLQSPQESYRRHAHERLTALTKKELPFDAAASADVRAQQTAAIAKRLQIK